MRTTEATEKSISKVVLEFINGGWTFSYFEENDNSEIWIKAMEKKYGEIKSKKIYLLK